MGGGAFSVPRISPPINVPVEKMSFHPPRRTYGVQGRRPLERFVQAMQEPPLLKLRVPRVAHDDPGASRRHLPRG